MAVNTKKIEQLVRQLLIEIGEDPEREGLVKVRGKGRGHKVELTITPKGRAALQRFLPDWRKAQKKVVQTLGAERWSAILSDLERASLAKRLWRRPTGRCRPTTSTPRPNCSPPLKRSTRRIRSRASG